MPSSSDLIDWRLARSVGRAVAGDGPSIGKHEAQSVARDFREHVERADELVRSYTGLVPVGETGRTAVIDRGSWIDVNTDAMGAMLSPVAERFAKHGPKRVSRMAIGLQIGLLLGYISQKVLGQYDLLLATGEAGRVYFVGPNIVAAEREHRLDTHDFRLWIALHEVTHRTQFLAVPWLRERVSGLIEQYLAGVKVDASRVREAMSRLKDVLAGGPDAWRSASIVDVFLSGEQREAIDRMQSLMSVVEGHGNFVMDGIGRTEIPTYERLREALGARRAQAGGAEKAFQKLIALDMKYEQYAVGQTFFDAVYAEGGMDAVNRVWERPESLPSSEELRDPGAWMRRVAPPQPTLFDSANGSAPA